MERAETLRQKVADLYGAKNPGRAEWADWLAENHVFVVASNAEKLAERYGADREVAMAAAMLHDVADAVMLREDPRHEERSLEIARELMHEAGFNDDEIAVAVDDAIINHSGKSGVPATLEGRVMMAADALGHLTTDFYDEAIRMTLAKGVPREKVQAWGLEKVDRDYFKKIAFDDLRAETTPAYERVKNLFVSL